MFSIVFIFLLNLAHNFCSLDHLNFYFSLFKGIVPRTINKNDRDIYPSTHSSITLLFTQHSDTVSKHMWRKRERGEDKKDIWDFYEPFSIQYAIPNKHYVYSRCICHGLYDALVIVYQPLSVEPLQKPLPLLLLRCIRWYLAKQLHVMQKYATVYQTLLHLQNIVEASC